MNETQVEGKIEIRGQFECRDKDGNLVKTIDFVLTQPIKKEDDGADDCE